MKSIRFTWLKNIFSNGRPPLEDIAGRHYPVDHNLITETYKCSCGFETADKNELDEHNRITAAQHYMSVNGILEHYNSLIKIFRESVQCPFCKSVQDWRGMWMRNPFDRSIEPRSAMLDRSVEPDGKGNIIEKFPVKK